MFPPVDWPRPKSSVRHLDLRCGQTPCSICGSGSIAHRQGWRGHEFVPWSQMALIDALIDSACAEPTPVPTVSVWMRWRHHLSRPLLWLAAKVGGC